MFCFFLYRQRTTKIKRNQGPLDVQILYESTIITKAHCNTGKSVECQGVEKSLLLSSM